MCAEKFGSSDSGKWSYAEACGDTCLACFWVPGCKY